LLLMLKQALHCTHSHHELW